MEELKEEVERLKAQAERLSVELLLLHSRLSMLMRHDGKDRKDGHDQPWTPGA